MIHGHYSGKMWTFIHAYAWVKRQFYHFNCVPLSNGLQKLGKNNSYTSRTCTKYCKFLQVKNTMSSGHQKTI